MTVQLIRRNLGIVLGILVVGASVLFANVYGEHEDGGEKHHGDNDCEWDEFGNVVCPEPTWTPDRPATQAAQTAVAANKTAVSADKTATAVKAEADRIATQAAVDAAATQVAAVKTAAAANKTATQVSANKTATSASLTATMVSVRLTATAIAGLVPINPIPPVPTKTPTPNRAATAVAANATATKVAANKTATKVAANKTATKVAANKTATKVAANKTATKVAANKTATVLAQQGNPVPSPTPTSTPMPTPTPTSTPTPYVRPPVGPTDWIKASPAKIAVGQQTTITAGWTMRSQRPSIVIDDPTVLADTCSGSTIRSPTQEGSAVLEGCSSGTTRVHLWDEVNNRALKSVTVTVMSVPSISSVNRTGYRFFDITWSAHSYFTDFHIEWRNVGEGDNEWRRLRTDRRSGARAIIQSWLSKADIRGLPYLHGVAIEFQLIALTEDEDSPETISPTTTTTRGIQPKARGHLPDHTMKYDLATLPGPGEDHAVLGGWIRDASTYGARIWAWAAQLVHCQGHCPSNSDRETCSLKVENGCDRDVPACLPAATLNVEQPMIVDLTIYFVPDSQDTPFRWTNIKAQDGDRILGSGQQYLWVDSVVVHEFGHAYGLADRNSPHSPLFYNKDYRGIMGVGATSTKTLFPGDLDYITSVYKTHTRNEGW